jgi:hypothetical protein
MIDFCLVRATTESSIKCASVVGPHARRPTIGVAASAGFRTTVALAVSVLEESAIAAEAPILCGDA